MSTLAFAQVNGFKQAYLEEGTGPLVILVHGFPDTAHTWDKIRPAIAAAGFRAVTPFLRGHFPSEPAPDGKQTIEAIGSDVLALIDALGEEQAVLIGHDWGAAAVFAATMSDPAKVKKLITVAIPHASGVIPWPRILWGARHFLRFQLPDTEKMIRANDFAHIDELLRRWSPRWNPGPEESAHVKECYRHPGSLQAALGHYRAMRPRDLATLSRPITVPAWAISGDHDPATRHIDFHRARPAYRASYEVVKHPGGHFLHREYPGIFEREIVRILKVA